MVKMITGLIHTRLRNNNIKPVLDFHNIKKNVIIQIKRPFNQPQRPMLTMLTFISLYVKQWSLGSDKQINFTIK